jgi:hypothetical protein
MNSVSMPPFDVEAARNAAAQAGRWLVVLGFRLRPKARPISRWTKCYANFLSDSATDVDRVAACRQYLDAVCLQIEFERWTWEAHYPPTSSDPDERAWRTTERGMALIAIAQLLREAIKGLERSLDGRS